MSQLHWVAELYIDLCDYYNREPNQTQEDGWVFVLRRYTRDDVETAIQSWKLRTDLDQFTKRIKGSMMPTPADLRASIEEYTTAARRRELAALGKYVPCKQDGCDDGWKRVLIGGVERVRRCGCFMEFVSHRREIQQGLAVNS
jgi:hypothetical protein